MEKLVLVRSTLVFLALSLALFLFEIVARVALPEPENLAKLRSSSLFIHENKPFTSFLYENSNDGFSNVITMNSYGFRDSEFKVEKEPGVFRIAVLGDSYEEALQVPLEDSWFEVMARRLSEETAKRVEAYNFGVSGYGTDQELLVLSNKVWQFNPDMVILGFSPNDIGDVYKNKLVRLGDDKIEVTAENLRPAGNFLGRVVQKTYTYHLLVKASMASDLGKWAINKIRTKILGFAPEERFEASDAQLVEGPFEVIASQKNPPKEVLETWPVVEALILDMRRQAEIHGAKFLVTINIPRSQVVSSDWDELVAQYKLDPATSAADEINRRFAQFAKRAGILFYDPRSSAFAWSQTYGPIHFDHDGHYNLNGNLFMGAKVSDFILENKLVRY